MGVSSFDPWVSCVSWCLCVWYQIKVPAKDHIMCQTSVNLMPCINCIKHTKGSSVMKVPRIHMCRSIISLNNTSDRQRSKFALAIGKCWGFGQGISMFFNICLDKKKCQGKWILRNLKKNTFPRIKKYIFVYKRKKMFLLIKKSVLSFTQFSNLIS